MKKLLSVALLALVTLSTSVSAMTAMDTGRYAQLSIENTAKYAEECVGIADPKFTGQYVFAKGLYKKNSQKFGVLVGIQTKNVVGSPWTKHYRCMFSLTDGSHSATPRLEADGTTVESYGSTEGEGYIK
jgi:hypothetical protein